MGTGGSGLLASNGGGSGTVARATKKVESSANSAGGNVKVGKKESAELERIAKRAIYSAQQRGDLKSRGNDEDDYLDTSVGGLERALENAYRYGQGAQGSSKISKQENKKLVSIAEKRISSMKGRGDFRSRGNDDDDFLDVSVWGLRTALEDAYKAGAQKRARKR